MLELNLPQYQYKVRKKHDRLEIFDAVRKKFVALTPEEWVRQHFVNYLLSHFGVPATHIKLEGGHLYNGLQKRCDIEVWDSHLRPRLIVECKASHIAVDEKVLHQLGSYNAGLQVPFLAVTNGLHHLYFSRSEENYCRLANLPNFEEMKLL